MADWQEFTGPIERAGWVVWYLKEKARRDPSYRATTAELCLVVNLSWSAMYRMLCQLERVTPLFHDEDGWWYEDG